MKKIILLSLIMSQIVNLNGQSLVVTGDNFVLNTDPCLQTHSSLSVKNVSSNTLNVLCEKVIIDTTLGTDNFFCWGANCYGSDTYISSSFNELLAGEGDAVDFGGYYDAYCATESATIQYCFFPETDINDRSCITIVYNESATFVKESSPYLISEFYPNPSEETTNFYYYINKPADLVLIDILGNQVMRIKLSERGAQKVNISDLSKGIYFGNMILNNEIVAIKKLIIN